MPTVGRKVAAMPVETAWLISRAMLMPLERMRVGINSERASHTHTPGPMAKNAMKTKRLMATSQPLWVLGTELISALSILSGSRREASRLLKGLEKNATTLLAGRQLARVISIGFAAGRSEALRPARGACRRSARPRARMLGCGKQMDNRSKRLEEILSFRMQG